MPGREAIRAQIRDPDVPPIIQLALTQNSTAAAPLTHQTLSVWVPDLRPDQVGPSVRDDNGFSIYQFRNSSGARLAGSVPPTLA